MSRLKTWWAGARDSLWLIPTLLTSLAFALAVATVELDRITLASGAVELGWVFGGGAEGSRGVLTTIATGIITVAGVVFSVTIVALQLASTQFTPRVLHHFMADRVNQWVLGVFFATFTYALMVQRSIRSATADTPGFVPEISVTVASLLALISVGFLILFINHMARSIQAAVIISRVMRETTEQIDIVFAEPYGGSAAGGAVVPATPPAVIRSDASGYLEAVDETALLEIDRASLVIQLEARIGEFVLPDTTLASVWPAAALDRELDRKVRKALVLGPERTPHQDVEFGVVQLTDIAVKALSPGINDPTTATQCIDRLGQILLMLGARELTVPGLRSRHGGVRVLRHAGSFERFVALAFDRIRYYARGDATVLRRLLDVLGRIAALLPEERRPPLAAQVEAVLRQADRAVPDPVDLETLRRAGEWAREQTAGYPERPAA